MRISHGMAWHGMAYVCTYIKANPTQHLEEEKNFKKTKNKETKKQRNIKMHRLCM